MDDAATAPGSVEFLVFGDASLLWRSGVVLAGAPPVPVSVALDGVRLLQLVVTVGTDTNAKDFADWADAAIAYDGAPPLPISRSALGAEPTRIALSSLPFERYEPRPAKFAIGLGLKESAPTRLQGVPSPAAITLHANHRIVINTAGRATRFEARLGVNDNAASSGSVRFQFLSHGRPLLETDVIRAGGPPEDVDLTLEGVQEFTIVVDDAADGENYDHAVIADAVFTVTEASPVITGVLKR